MFIQILLGIGLILISVFIASLGFFVLEFVLRRVHSWLMREPHGIKLGIVMVCAVSSVLMLLSAGVWIWAIAFELLGIFGTFEEALYFSLVSFTTLGFGDILAPQEWRLLSGMVATNGFLNFGIMTAFLTEVVRHVRRNQLEARERAKEPQL